ncbi:SMI1/KNR4 family protein [Paenibacillus sp. URB8-2]|uniref:SMI1/KNR4 family protein n=1 Tax=Paenibacillus sp. URB8-2 TaxID=2741301 RepID=UPI0015B7AB52|nr:SMI1/KNR4 family protein [Paenibacillus sp. URB8-2]BCG58119.1 SMI1/KNR4 family protein [Paenibacillus sp. URB8-2]
MEQANNVKWILAKDELSREDVLKVEEALGVSFPSDYVDCVVLNNGGQPVPDTFDFKGRSEAVFNSLIDLNVRENRNIIGVYNNLKNRLPGSVYPFADDPFGNYLCFDYHEGNEPSIVFWDHEKANLDKNLAIDYICSSFNVLIDKLHKS